MIGKWFILSYFFGASNMRFKHDMINVSFLSPDPDHQTNPKVVWVILI